MTVRARKAGQEQIFLRDDLVRQYDISWESTKEAVAHGCPNKNPYKNALNDQPDTEFWARRNALQLPAEQRSTSDDRQLEARDRISKMRWNKAAFFVCALISASELPRAMRRGE
jgi:hypothetical protein